MSSKDTAGEERGVIREWNVEVRNTPLGNNNHPTEKVHTYITRRLWIYIIFLLSLHTELISHVPGQTLFMFHVVCVMLVRMIYTHSYNVKFSILECSNVLITGNKSV